MTTRTPRGALARVCYRIESDSYSAEGFLYIGGFVYKVEVNAESRPGALSALDDALEDKKRLLTSSAT